MAYYGTESYLEDKDFTDRLKAIFRGDLGLDWMKPAGEEVKCEVPPGRFSYANVNVGAYGYDVLPEYLRGNRSLAPRGAQRPAELPDFQPTVNDRDEVWGYNVVPLYEEAKTRQWNATTDIPWRELDRYEVPPEIETAFCQLCTFLTEVEMIATDLPAKWMSRVNADLLEAKSFFCTQAMDEARHLEVFRKRALAGVGLLKSSTVSEHALKAILDADTFSEASAFLHVLGEGGVLSLFRHSEFISPTEMDKKMFRLVMQDEARHVSYGTMHLKWILDHRPERREAMHQILDMGENFIQGVFSDPANTEALVILAGKGLKKENIEQGVEFTKLLTKQRIEEYFQRCARAGLAERRERSRLTELLALMGE
jgi:hypothetical protein